MILRFIKLPITFSYPLSTSFFFVFPICLFLWIIVTNDMIQGEYIKKPGKGVAPSLHLGVVAIEKGAFGSPSTMVAYFTYFTLRKPLLIERIRRKLNQGDLVASFFVFLRKEHERQNIRLLGGFPRAVIFKALDCGIIECKFELQSCYYVHFQTNSIGKGMNLLILPGMG